MCFLKRYFYNVGNALFCKETVLNHTIIYDCGKVDFGCDDNIIVNETIDAVFISHYDKDHINGIFNLIKKANVKTLILPLVSYDIKFLSLLKDEKIIEAQLDFIIDAKQAIIEYTNKDNVNVVYIKGKVNHAELNNETSYSLIYASQRHYQSYIINNLDKTEIDNLPLFFLEKKTDNKVVNNWLFLPYNPYVFSEVDEKNFFQMLNDSLAEQGLNLKIDKNNIKEEWNKCKDMKKYIKCADINIIPMLKNKNTNYNDYCMTLYSGPFNMNSSFGCLYMGDYNAKKYFDELYEVYEKFWCNIFTLQVPHHGSLNNFNHKFTTVP